MILIFGSVCKLSISNHLRLSILFILLISGTVCIYNHIHKSLFLFDLQVWHAFCIYICILIDLIFSMNIESLFFDNRLPFNS